MVRDEYPLVGCRLTLRGGIQLEACGGKCRCRDARTLIWLRGERERGEENGGASDVGALADEKNKRETRRGRERKRLGRILRQSLIKKRTSLALARRRGHARLHSAWCYWILLLGSGPVWRAAARVPCVCGLLYKPLPRPDPPYPSPRLSLSPLLFDIFPSRFLLFLSFLSPLLLPLLLFPSIRICRFSSSFLLRRSSSLCMRFPSGSSVVGSFSFSLSFSYSRAPERRYIRRHTWCSRARPSRVRCSTLFASNRLPFTPFLNR